MNFNEFLNLKEDKFKYYMTTQKIPYDSVGPKYLTDGALLNLLEEKDYRPSLIGNLVPNQYNMWMGFSGEKGSSTGLHFDYHDNIYVLVKGKKKFTISCPVNVQELKVNGDVKVVHKNGLIALNSDCQSDGHFSDDSESENEDSRSFQFGQNFNDEMFNLTPKELKKKLNQIQQKINNLKEQINKNPENIEDLKFQLGEAEQNEEELLDIELGLTLKGEQIIDDFDENEDENLKADVDEDDEQEEPLQEDPDNFVISKLQKVNYHRLCSVFEVIVNEGQMLYLPASWYHQVNSYGEFHFAFNYWMHPPNNDKFEQPYKTQYWENRYKQVKLNTDKRKNELNKNTHN
ncbi:hypothetical protein PPERSA_09788 [Pseudocohnilembus persalinus]|uniref:JmjC domain-containing protein n=1 Tax=Pseudocohnilembus persalinus TaxID=266149 RepID=A0A0V0QUJ6_PSEPJ|nr:hypothetical protein PPERSA_09788 [Pseudocohnilembus persalinus]|eukprot:KRX05648.1 hypothetical protein PPERSA_09788 [Pseudocohnilembus persalinus]